MSSGPAVITYHGIVPNGYNVLDGALDGNLVDHRTFVKQIKLLKMKCNIVSPQQFLSWGLGESDLPARAVLLSCDDGLLNNVTDMLPILVDLQIPCLFFVTGDAAEQRNRMLWHEQLYLWLLSSEDA